MLVNTILQISALVSRKTILIPDLTFNKVYTFSVFCDFEKITKTLNF